MLSSTRPPQETLTSGGFDRLDGYRIFAAKSGLCKDGRFECAFALAKVCQNVEHTKALFTDFAPALLTNTCLWDLVEDVPVGVTAHWLIMGFPHPLAQGVSEEAARYFPCSASIVHVSSGLCGRSQRQLTGNAMHLAAVGSWVAYNLFMLRFQP